MIHVLFACNKAKVFQKKLSKKKFFLNLGQGSILKNIKIYGGTASAVKLPTSKECMQYCTGKFYKAY